MTQKRIESATAQPTVPPILVSWLAVFRPCFTAPVWNHILALVGGAVLAPGKRTVTQALRVMGLADKPGFGRYHEVLDRARWDARDVARRLLLHLLAVLSPSGEVVIGIDDTSEIRGLTHSGVDVAVGTKIIEVHPRGDPSSVFGLDERPRRIAEGVCRALANSQAAE
jgi:hypothetical protein